MGIAAAVFCAAAPAARAERLVFERAGVLYAAALSPASRSATPVATTPRRLFAPAVDAGPPVSVRWSPSPDGRRIAWAVPSPPDAAGRFALWVAELNGGRRKRLLVSDALRDRGGNRVTRVALPGAPAAAPAEVAAWALDALCWSADGKSLYLSLAAPSARTSPFVATFVADAATGAAVVDADGRWRALAVVGDVDAGGLLLAGVARDLRITIIDLSTGATNVLDGAVRAGAPERPALSPDGKALLFANPDTGLWYAELAGGGRRPRRVTFLPGDTSPRWREDGRRVLFLAPGAAGAPSTAAAAFDLFETTVPAGAAGTRAVAPAPARRRLLRDVVRFFVIPD
jgi:dipeptidyl aminopeptidase/acylaminoacyl peptidase